MSSTFHHSSVGAYLEGDLELDQEHIAALDRHLSPFSHTQTLSNSASPSYNIDSTPAESLSEYSNYQPSELELSEVEDPFFGVNFDAGVPRVDSIPTAAIFGNVAYNSTSIHHPSSPVSRVDKARATSLTRPLSPVHSSTPNTPPTRRLVYEPPHTISPQELSKAADTHQFPTLNSVVPTHPADFQLTPDHSSGSQSSADGIAPSTMSTHDQIPRLAFSRAAYVDQTSHGYHSPRHDFQHSTAPSGTSLRQDSTGSGIMRNEDGSWRSSNAAGQGGWNPEARQQLEGVNVPTLKEQDKRRVVEAKNSEVDQWATQAGEIGVESGDPNQYPPFNYANSIPQAQRNRIADDDGIAPLDDNMSLHQNRLIDGQTYFDTRATHINDSDIKLMKQPRHWSDAPAYPYILEDRSQPETAQEAIQKFFRHADSISIASRVATWGTRRRSEPSLKDAAGVLDGSFLKKLSVKSPNRPRQGSLLDGLTNIVRQRSDSKLKRMRSTQNIPEEPGSQNHPRQGSQGSLVPPPRTSSFGRRQPSTPTVNTGSAFAAMAGSLAAVGTTHARSGSVSASNTSPKSPSHLGFSSVFNRSRSKSDVAGQGKDSDSALGGLWKSQGGPPVPKLGSKKSQSDSARQELQLQDDAEEDDDEDDENVDEGEMGESDLSSQPIEPNYEGFKAHVRRVNSDMKPEYNWLVSRVAHQQEIRYKNLLELRVRHSQAVIARNCISGPHCLSMNRQTPTDLDRSGPQNEVDVPAHVAGLQVVTEFSDDSNHTDNALTDEVFPAGVPMPPTRSLPDEFECQLCFKVKKFQKPSDWTKHVHEDVQPFTCTYEKCKESKSFKRKADWVRHENERHRHLEWWVCQVDDCRHMCFRKDNFLQHLVREHKLPEPKQKSKAAIKKARLTEPAWLLLEQCHHETQNEPQDEPCKFCGKTFPTWKKLTVHLAKHMENISLPILPLVKDRIVDANTIISPVDNNLTPAPVTPTSAGPKAEASASPFDLAGVSPHAPVTNHFVTTAFEHGPYFPTAGQTAGYAMQTSLSQGSYPVNDLYPSSFQPMNQARGFHSLNVNTMGNMQQPRGFDSMHDAFQPKVEQQDYNTINTAFFPMQGQQNFIANQNSPYAATQPFSSAPPVSSFQAPNILGIDGVPYDFNQIPVDSVSAYHQQPVSRRQRGTPSYSNGNSPQHHVPFYQ